MKRLISLALVLSLMMGVFCALAENADAPGPDAAAIVDGDTGEDSEQVLVGSDDD